MFFQFSVKNLTFPRRPISKIIRIRIQSGKEARTMPKVKLS